MRIQAQKETRADEEQRPEQPQGPRLAFRPEPFAQGLAHHEWAIDRQSRDVP